MARISIRSISVPIVLASVAVALSIALLVAWTIVVAQKMSLSEQVAENAFLLVAGILSLVLIMSVLVMFSVFLVSEILEVRRQTSFIDSVTHELKSPLASIKLCLETLQRPALDEKQRGALHQMMLADVERLTLFIDDVLEASLVAHGRRPHVMTEVELHDVARQSAFSVTTRYNLPPQAIAVAVPPELRLVTDRVALEAVMKNLLDNAVKYSNAPVDVRVVAEKDGDEVQLVVEDAGIGIAKHDLKRIFDRFYRVPNEAVRARRGTGLGLFVVSALVRSLGGRIEARSPGVGQGTRIIVRLPAGGGRGRDGE